MLSEALDLQPITYSDADAATIYTLNTRWQRRVDTLLAQLRSKQYKNVEEASMLHHFYMYALAMVEVNRYSFPNTKLTQRLRRILKLLPREYRPTILYSDLSAAEIDRHIQRVSKRLDLVVSPSIRKKKSRKKCRRSLSVKKFNGGR